MKDKTLLPFTIIQSPIFWEQKEENIKQYERLIAGAKQPKGIVVLPEMFNTGFSMRPQILAEKMNGSTVQWMVKMSVEHGCILTGSLIIEEDHKFYNRMLWVQPDGQIFHYDKRHLFAYAEEDKQFTAGENRVIVQVNGWKILLLVCYDLRFPVWARNQDEAYDVIIYVANWPERRSVAWETLLRARAIENQSFVIGVNRVGTDGNNIAYKGGSAVIDALGNILWAESGQEAVHQIQLSKTDLLKVREEIPFLKDADKFLIL